MYHVKLTALRPLYGDYGPVDEGGSFITDNLEAERLMARGLAERYREPEPLTLPSIPAFLPKAIQQYENKAVQPEAVKVEQPTHRRRARR